VNKGKDFARKMLSPGETFFRESKLMDFIGNKGNPKRGGLHSTFVMGKPVKRFLRTGLGKKSLIFHRSPEKKRGEGLVLEKGHAKVLLGGGFHSLKREGLQKETTDEKVSSRSYLRKEKKGFFHPLGNKGFLGSLQKEDCIWRRGVPC